MKKFYLLAFLLGLLCVNANAQRTTDKLDRGLVAVKVSNGVFCSWRILGEEYYDVTYNLYRDGTLIAEGLSVSNYTDTSGSASSTYTVAPVVRGSVKSSCPAKSVQTTNYKEIKMNHGSLKSTYIPNDACCADVDGDGELEILLKYDNQSESSNYMQRNGYYGEYSLFEVLKQDGTVLWRVNCGPNMGDFQNNEQNIVAYDWDQDGKAEVVMRLEEGSIIYMADGTSYVIGADGQNGSSWTNYREPRYVSNTGATVAMTFGLSSSATATCSASWASATITNGVLYVTAQENTSTTDSRTTTVTVKDGETTSTYSLGQLYNGQRSVEWFTHYGNEFLVYCDGQTGKPYVVTEFPLKRLESGETDLNKAWGDGYGHRSSKFFFGAPYLDGRKPSIFLARGIYTRHKMIAYDVNPFTHELSVRWRWNCSDSSSPWYGNGYHNYAIADVDWDGRDEICFGSMVIDDNGKGLSTTGLGHGDAQHHSDFDPYTWGHEIFACNEDAPSNNYRDATTSKIRYRMAGGDDDGRCMAGNFCNDYPGAMAFSAHDTPISCVTNNHITGLVKSGVTDNMRIYWDGDLQEECFNYSNGKNTAGGIYKYGKGLIATLTGSMTNNDTKGTPCYQGDLFGDWREEVIMRTADNNIRIYTTTTSTTWRNYTLWHDMQYRQAMVWQMCGYNQPPHVSYFLGELEGITQAPPALTMTNRTEIANGGSITTNDEVLITCETNNMEVSVADGASPYIYIDNAPSWVQGTNSTSTTNPDIKYEYYTHTLTGGAFSGTTRIIKQGDGTLVLPATTHKHTGATDVWAGKLQCDGILESSPLWLNRHTSLISNGGQFLGGITADYNATIYPGGQDNVGAITATSINLGFGSRVVFDINDTHADQMNANTLTIEKKVWPNGGGPVYDTPVFLIKGNPAAGTYNLGSVNEITGDISNIIVEGLTGKKATLSYQDNKLTLTIIDYEAQDLTWTGSSNGVWNTDETVNFKNTDGESKTFIPGSTVTFDDNAQQTDITISGNVAPKSIVFNNESKTFTIAGDSLCGEPTITKNGAGEVIINNVNHTGITTINAGTLTVNSMANDSGNDYGSVGSVKKGIIINDGATLGIKATTVSNQPIRIASGNGNIRVASGATLTQSAIINASGNTLTKTGAGTLGTPANLTATKLIIQQGTVQATENSSSIKSLPATVEFQGGTLKDNVNIYSYSTNNANFVVPEGKTGTFYADSRCNYKGKLTGSGTFNVYATSVRGYFQGDWSAFEGTIVANTYNSDSYDENFLFDNNYGLPKATLKINSGVTFNNNGHNVQVANVTGTGTLGGSGTYTLGADDSDIAASFSSTAPIVKTGKGTMTVTRAGAISGQLTIQQGELVFYGNETTQFFGSSVTLKDGATMRGSGMLSSFIMENGSTLTPITQSLIDFSDVPGTIKTTAACRINEGAVLNMQIMSANEYSKLEPKYLFMNGTLKVTLLDGYVPKVGDSFTLWTATTYSGTLTYSLPTLPEGLYWDTRNVASKTGVLSITDDASLGIGTLGADTWVACEVYTLGGVHVCSLESQRSNIRNKMKAQGLQPGTYIVKMLSGRNSVTETIIVR